MYVRVCLEEAVISSRGGASARCLYLAGEPSEHLRARVAPSPFALRAWRGALRSTDRWVRLSGAGWMFDAVARVLRWLQAARDAAGAGPHGEQAGARDGLISSRNRQVGEVPEMFRRLRRAWRLAALLNFCMGAREKRLEFC